MLTGQLLVTAVLIAVWIALVSSWLPSPPAPLHRTSSHGRPEHIRTSPFRVAVPVVDSVEKLPGDCASAPQAVKQIASAASTALSASTYRHASGSDCGRPGRIGAGETPAVQLWVDALRPSRRPLCGLLRMR